MRPLPFFAPAAAAVFLLACDDKPDPSASIVAPAEAVQASVLTKQPALARAVGNKAELKPILTVGDPLPGQEDNPDPEQRVWAPTPDGLGAFAGPDGLVLFANHELTSGGVDGRFAYARVSRLVLDPSTLEVKSGSYPITGKANGFLFQRLCSATFVGPDEGFGAGWFLTGEESTTGGAEGIQLAVRNDGKGVKRLPWLGRFAHENYIAVPGFGQKVVMLGTDDSSPVSAGAPGQSELYMYVADSRAGVLNGDGKLYVFKTSQGSTSGDLTVGHQIQGRFVEIDRPGTLSASQLQAKVDQRQAFKFVRLEDIDYDRRDGSPAVYFVDTGNLNLLCGASPCDLYGSIYRMELDAADPTQHARLTLLARSQGAETGFASPDNIALSRQSLMVQEDPAYAGFNRPEKIWNFPLRADGGLGAGRAVAALETRKFTGNLCSDAAGTCWESSGIIDASEWLGAGTWLFDVQGHTLPFSYKDKGTTVNLSKEGGQLLYLKVQGS
jgi:hypothetical protein